MWTVDTPADVVIDGVWDIINRNTGPEIDSCPVAENVKSRLEPQATFADLMAYVSDTEVLLSWATNVLYYEEAIDSFDAKGLDLLVRTVSRGSCGSEAVLCVFGESLPDDIHHLCSSHPNRTHDELIGSFTRVYPRV